MKLWVLSVLGIFVCLVHGDKNGRRSSNLDFDSNFFTNLHGTGSKNGKNHQIDDLFSSSGSDEFLDHGGGSHGSLDGHGHDGIDIPSGGSSGLLHDLQEKPHGQCEPIKIDICQGVGYNQTMASSSLIYSHSPNDQDEHHAYHSQDDSEQILQTFTPLIQYGCSPHLKIFLCSAYVPLCNEKIDVPIGPCRAFCETVRGSCEPILKEFGLQWPEALNCSRFHPENNHENMCNSGPIHILSSNGPPSGSLNGNLDFESNKNLKILFGNQNFKPTNHNQNNGMHPQHPQQQPPQIQIIHPPQTQNPHFPLRNLPLIPPMVTIPSKPEIISTSSNNNEFNYPLSNQEMMKCTNKNTLRKSYQRIWLKNSCWIKCPEKYFKKVNPNLKVYPSEVEEIENLEDFYYIMIIRRVVLVLSSISFISGLFTVVAFAYFIFCSTQSNDFSPFPRSNQQPNKRGFPSELKNTNFSQRLQERPIFYISLCQLLHSVGLIIASASAFHFVPSTTSTFGHLTPLSCYFDKASGLELLAKSDHVPGLCSLVFITTYFFSLASSLWWVNLTWSWLILSLNLNKLRRSAKNFKFEPVKPILGNKRARENSSFHLISWGVASLFTSMALVFKKIDADEFSGICGVGFQDGQALKYYCIYPLIICLAFGVAFLSCGFLFQLNFKNLNFKSHFGKKNPSNLLTNAGSNSVITTTNGPIVEEMLLLGNHQHQHHHNHLNLDVSALGTYTSLTQQNSVPESPNCPECLREKQQMSQNPFFEMSTTTLIDQRRKNLEILKALKRIRKNVGLFASLHIVPMAIHICTMTLFSSDDWLNQMLKDSTLITISTVSLLRISMSVLPAFTTCFWVCIIHFDDLKRLSLTPRNSQNRGGIGRFPSATATTTTRNSGLRLKSVGKNRNSQNKPTPNVPQSQSFRSSSSSNTQQQNNFNLNLKTDTTMTMRNNPSGPPVFLSSFTSGPTLTNTQLTTTNSNNSRNNKNSELSSRNFNKPKPLKKYPPSLPLPSLPNSSAVSSADFGPFSSDQNTNNNTHLNSNNWRRGETIV